MAKPDWLNIRGRTDALLLVMRIVSHFDTETRWQSDGRRLSAIGTVGSLAFGVLAEESGAFVRPVPLRRDHLCANIDVSRATLTRAIKRLVEHGLLTMSGSRRAPMAMLHLPEHVVALYEVHERKLGTAAGDLLGRDELGRAVALLDQADVDDHTSHDAQTRH